MNRLHIHFSPGELGDSQVISGLRSSCQLYIYIDSERALTGKSLTLIGVGLLLYYVLPLVRCVIFWTNFLS
jgi:hypothetical protein